MKPPGTAPTNSNGNAPQADVAAEPAGLGRRRFIIGAGAAAGAGVLAAAMPGHLAHAALPAGASRFVPLANAVRLADTRSPSAYSYSTPDARRIRVKIAGANGIPASASAAVLTVTAVNGSQGNFVTVYPSGGALPLASNLNLLSAGEQNANLVTAKIGAGGSVDVYGLAACSMIVDVLGYYEPVAGAVRGGRFVGLPNARRAIDTRPALAGSRSFTTVDLTSYVPADASSVVINLTATETTGPSFFTALPYDAPAGEPATSSLNVSRPGDTRAAGVIVPVPTIGRRRRIKIFTLHPAKLIVDVVGYYTSDTSPSSEDGLFVPVTPVRLIDTRVPGGEVGKLWPAWVVEVKPPASVASKASAIVANVTGVEVRGPGFLTVTAARQPVTLTSNVNFSAPHQVVPNHVITPVTSTYGLQVYSSHGAHVIVDMAGYFTGSPMIPQRPKWVNPAPPAAPPAWTLRVPRLGLTSAVIEGNPGPVTDAGHSWHWSGTGHMGEENAHVATFAHRTEAGAPYRNLHLLQNGDVVTVTTGDNREYTYRVVRRELTNSANANILSAVRRHPGTTLSLVACTVGHDRSKSAWPDVWAPTSLKYRIVVTAEFVSWREF